MFNFKTSFPFLYYRRRLISSVLIGSVLWHLLPEAFTYTSRLLVAFDTSVIIYLTLVFGMMYRSTQRKESPRAMQEDEGAVLILILTILASLLSLASIVLELSTSAHLQGSERLFSIILTVLTIIISWVFMHTIFALHYAHLYYRDVAHNRSPNLIFPDKHPQPDYWDFVYFSFVIGTSAQTADVSFASRETRKIGTLHTVLAFFYNTAILAFMINISASLINH